MHRPRRYPQTQTRAALAAATFAILIAGVARAADRPPVGEVVRKMQAFYNQTRDLKSKFKQVYTDTLYNRQRTSFGYLYVRKPGMMRWNYVQPERKAFIVDGKDVWVWEPEDKQAFRNPLNVGTLSTGLTFLLGSGDLTKEFRISYGTAKQDLLGGPDDLVLKLEPLKPTAQYQYLVLGVRATDHAVTESMVVAKHSRNHFIFTKLETNTRLAKARFQFRAPAGTKIISNVAPRRSGP